MSTTMQQRKKLESVEAKHLAVSNRMKYLAAQQKRYEAKIQNTRQEIDRRNKINAGKIEDLSRQMEAQKER